MNEAFICDFSRTPIGRYEGGLARVRPDDLAATAIRHLVARNAGIGAAVALTIGAVALWSWYSTPGHAHWTQLIAILLMAPAAQFGALFRRLDY